MNKKYVLSCVLLICILALSGIVYLSFSWSGKLEDQPRGFEAEKPYSYLVSTNGSYTVAYNSSGFEEFGGTEAKTIINWAIGNLTSGRIYKETIYLTGNFTLTNRIILASYLHLTGDAYLILDSGNSDSKTTLVEGINLEYVEISGLTFDGDYTNHMDATGASEGTDILISGSKHVKVHHCVIMNARKWGFYTLSGYSGSQDCYDIQVDHNTFLHNQWNDCMFSHTEYGSLHHCSAKFNYAHGAGDLGFNTFASVGYYCRNISFIGNFIDGLDGIYGSASPDHYWGGIKLERAKSCVVSNNIITGVRYGIAEDSAGKGEHIISNNLIVLKDVTMVNKAKALRLFNNRSTIEGNTIYAPPTNGTTLVYCTGTKNKFIGNTLLKGDGTGTITGFYDSSGTVNMYIGNDAETCDTGFSVQGGAIKEHNWE